MEFRGSGGDRNISNVALQQTTPPVHFSTPQSFSLFLSCSSFLFIRSIAIAPSLMPAIRLPVTLVLSSNVLIPICLDRKASICLLFSLHNFSLSIYLSPNRSNTQNHYSSFMHLNRLSSLLLCVLPRVHCRSSSPSSPALPPPFSPQRRHRSVAPSDSFTVKTSAGRRDRIRGYNGGEIIF